MFFSPKIFFHIEMAMFSHNFGFDQNSYVGQKFHFLTKNVDFGQKFQNEKKQIWAKNKQKLGFIFAIATCVTT